VVDVTTSAQPLVGQVPEELDRLRDLYRERQPVRVLEIGVWHGGTLREWLAEDPDVVVAVDPDPQVTDYDVGEHTQFFLVIGRSQEDHVRDQIREHAPYDWVFIDGDHAYDAVKADTDLALEVTRKGGLVVLHDIIWDRATGSIGPDQAFNELAHGRKHWTIVEDPEPSGYPSNNAHGFGIVQV
jgi:predicted O-methyltransferase YrrM